MVVIVEERPAIASVDFTGAKEFEKAALIKSLKDVGLGEGRIYDRALLDRAEHEFKIQYLSHGLYGVQITTTITPVERNRVAVNFTIDEVKSPYQPDQILFGNKAFSDKKAGLNVIKCAAGGLPGIPDDQYSRKLTGDLVSPEVVISKIALY